MLHKHTKWQIRGDLHVHASHSSCDRHKSGDPVAYHSDCGVQAIAEMRSYLRAKHYEYLAIVNHASDPVNPEQPSDETTKKIQQHINAIEQVNTQRDERDPLLIPGVEASLLPEGSIDVTTNDLCNVEVAIAARHGTTTHWSVADTIQHLKRVFASMPINILGHPTRYAPMESVDAYQALLELCKTSDVAFELNLRTPFGHELVHAVVESDVLLSLGSDIHGELMKFHDRGMISLATIPILNELNAAGLEEHRIINTWRLADIRKFLASRRSMCQ
jgi:histidinol phosphatase-like PHP family hydrolase